MSGRLSGKVAIVTGGSRGIGAAIAKRFGAEGAKVAINFARSISIAEDLAKIIRDRGSECELVQGDLSEPMVAKELFAATMRAYGRVDILVNNAGVGERRPLEEVDAEHFERLFSINVRAPLLMTSEAARFLPEGGRVINISSRAAHSSVGGNSVYSASKAALEALTRVHAAELGPRGITVNAVAPGPVDTEMLRDFITEEFRRDAIERTPLHRLGTAEDIADVVAFLASDDSRWLTGQVINANGGLSMR